MQVASQRLRDRVMEDMEWVEAGEDADYRTVEVCAGADNSRHALLRRCASICKLMFSHAGTGTRYRLSPTAAASGFSSWLL